MASVVMVTRPPSATIAATRDGTAVEARLSHSSPTQCLGKFLATARTERRNCLRNVTGRCVLVLYPLAVGCAQDEPAAVFGLDRHRLGHRVLDVDRHTFGARVQRA